MARLAAELLEAPWCDLDARIEAAAGRCVTDLFRDEGEPAFRDRERAAMAAALAEGPQVIAAGGGWAAQPGNLADVELRTLTIYMSLSPVEAARRLRGSEDRPLLAGHDPVERLTALLAERERWYRLAGMEIAVGGASPEGVAASIAVAARQYGGW